MRFQLNRDINFAAIDDTEGIVFDPITMASFSANETGLWLFRQAETSEGILDTDALGILLAKEYGVSAEQARQDIQAFCEILYDRGLATTD